MHFLNHLGSVLVQRGLRINFIFNSVLDVANARRLIREDIEQHVKLNVLGVGRFSQDEDIAVLVCPSNEGNENLGRIEAVERQVGIVLSLMIAVSRWMRAFQVTVLWTPTKRDFEAVQTGFSTATYYYDQPLVGGYSPALKHSSQSYPYVHVRF